MTDRPTDQPQDSVVGADRPTDQPLGRVDRPTTDQATTPIPLTLEEAAIELGITVNAVRQRIKRGTLVGIKTEAGWLVDMVATNHQPTTDRPSTSATDQPTNQARRPTDHQPTSDLAPLVSHIATLEDQVQRLTEASTMWQIRARQAEEQLKVLTAGETPPETSPEALESPPANDPAPTGLGAWWKRLWRG
jgi:hypothetical protein